MLKNILKKIIFYNITRRFFCYIQIIYYCFKKNHYDVNNQPVFLVSTNRSGSSLFASIIRQHPALRTLSPEDVQSDIKMNNSHTMGFSEDNIWKFLDNYNNNVFKGIKDGFMWGDPKYISDFYRDDFKFKKALIYEIYKVKSNEIPFVNHSFFTLRLKLIKKLFPNAKIIFNIRSYKDFIKSNIHKNFNDNRFKDFFKNSDPDIGLHWNIINSICAYQLEKYFKNQYFIFNHEKFYDTNFDNQNLMDELTDFLKLDKFSFSFDLVNTEYKHSKNITFEYDNMDFAQEISKYEKTLYEQLRSKK